MCVCGSECGSVCVSKVSVNINISSFKAAAREMSKKIDVKVRVS